jgi:hypothetical protein
MFITYPKTKVVRFPDFANQTTNRSENRYRTECNGSIPYKFLFVYRRFDVKFPGLLILKRDILQVYFNKPVEVKFVLPAAELKECEHHSWGYSKHCKRIVAVYSYI